MVLSYTFDSLKTDIMNWTENDSAEFQAVLGTIIGLAELRIVRDSDLDVFRKYARSFFGPSDRFLSKPDDMVIDRHMEVEINGSKYALARKDTSFLNMYWPDATQMGTPRFYSDWDEDNFVIVPTPADSYVVELAYTYRPEGLSDATPTTWLSLNAPDILLFACMVEATRFEKGEAQEVAGWKDAYAEALARLNREEMGRQRRTEYTAGEPRGTI